jgi:lipopolysaccharide cholinephosphotransferase
MTEMNQIQKTELEILIEMDKICKEYNLRYYLAFGTLLGAVRHKGFIPWDTDVDIIVGVNDYKRFCDTIQSKISKRYFIYSTWNDPTYEELFARIGLKNDNHLTTHVDIFPMVGTPKTVLGRKIFSRIAYITHRGFFLKKVNVKINYKNNKLKKIIASLLKIILMPVPAKLFMWLFQKLSVAFPIEESDVIYNFIGFSGYRGFIPKSFLGEPVMVDFEGHEFPAPEKWHEFLSHFYGDYMVPRRKNYISKEKIKP